MAFSDKVRVFLLLSLFIFLIKVSDGFWAGGQGGWSGQFGLGGFHSGFGHQGYGYGPGLCSGVRQRQGIYNNLPQQPVSPYSYNNDGHSEGYYHNPSLLIKRPVQQITEPATLARPIQNTNLDYRVNLPATVSQPAATPTSTTCSHPNIRDATVFSQQCIFPHETEQYSCSSRGKDLPLGTTSITTCKSPPYYSDTGDAILEICKDGKWHSDGKTLTCKSTVIVTQQPATAPYLSADQDDVHFPQNLHGSASLEIPENGSIISPIPQDLGSQYKQPYWTYTQPAPFPSKQHDITQTNEVTKDINLQTLPQVWNFNQTKASLSPSKYSAQYPPYFPSSSTTTSPTTPEPTTTTQRPFHLLESIDWRQYYKTKAPVRHQSNSFYNPTEDNNSNHLNFQQNVGKCSPLQSKDGVILECISKSTQNSNNSPGYLLSISDCHDPQPIGTEATYKCKMYYEPLTGLPTQYRKCKDNGDWTGNDDGFGCKLECGKSNPAGRLPLITYGEMTILGQWPWHAALFIRDRDEISNACGGTLITKKAVLTAAHCVNLYLSSLTRDLNDIRVDLGRYYRNKDDPYVQRFEVEKIVTHPAYNPFIFESDIAIIILKNSAKIGFHVRPICFPKSQNTAFDEMHLADGSYATVVGWGVDETGESPDELRSAKIQVVGYRECIESFDEADTGALLAKSTTFCASNKNKTNVCRGDSGSGAFFPVKTSSGSTVWYLQGIVSLGINVSANDKKCDPEKVSIFTRVSPYADWINRVLSENDAM